MNVDGPDHRRLSHSTTQVGSYLFIAGGHTGTSYTSEVLYFNLGAFCPLVLLAGTATSVLNTSVVSLSYESRVAYGKPPSSRGYHAAIVSDSRLFVFGGFNGQTALDDCHILDLAGTAYLPQVMSFQIEL